ncbi:MAG: bactofilin family protein [Salinispira sp.]
MEAYPDDNYVNSLIGFGSNFRGDIEISGFFRIDGDFSGSIKTESRVLIGNNGRADCTITARVVVIGGIFRGTIYAHDKIVALSSALIIGNMYAPRLVAENGVLLHGSLIISGNSKGRPKNRTEKKLSITLKNPEEKNLREKQERKRKHPRVIRKKQSEIFAKLSEHS